MVCIHYLCNRVSKTAHETEHNTERNNGYPVIRTGHERRIENYPCIIDCTYKKRYTAEREDGNEDDKQSIDKIHEHIFCRYVCYEFSYICIACCRICDIFETILSNNYDRFHLKCHDCQNHKNQKTWTTTGFFLLFLAKLTWIDSKRDLLCSSFYFFIIQRVVTFQVERAIESNHLKEFLFTLSSLYCQNNDQTPPEHVSPCLCRNPGMPNSLDKPTPRNHPTETPTTIATAHNNHYTSSDTTTRQPPRTTRHAPPRATAPRLGAPRLLHTRHRPPGATHPLHISPQPRPNTSILPDALPTHPGRPPPRVPGLARDRGVDGKRRHVRARERAQNMHECRRPRRRAHAVLFLCRLSR